MPEYSEEIQDSLISLVKHFDEEDRVVREYQLRHYRRLKLYWNNFNQIFWSESARDYRIAASSDAGQDATNQAYYDRPVNVFRAFLETIIAALAIQIPKITCVPDDADNPNDIMTAKAGSKIAELIYKHNDLIWVWLQGLYIHCTEGMVAAYCYERCDEKYGTYSEAEYKDEEVEALVCPHCQTELEEGVLTGQLQLPQDPEQLEMLASMKNAEALEFSGEQEVAFDPGDEEVELNNVLNQTPVCPECGNILDPNLQKSKLTIPRFVGNVNKPKSRVCIDVYGGLYVKVANYAKKPCDTPYLIFSYETNYVNVLEEYDFLKDKIPHGGSDSIANAASDPYAQQARLNPQYRNAFPVDQVTCRYSWLRPASFNFLPEDKAKQLRKKFPNGAKVVLVNEIFAEACNQDLDDHWTLTRNPLHDYLCHDPLGELLLNIQDIVNDLISLILQTIEHGILQVWADPSVVNFNGQQQVDAAPGTITPTKPTSGSRSIGEAFFTTKAAALAPEVFQFYQIIFQLGQFVSGAMPSIYGGQQQGSETASEYAMSKAASLQRLQTTWTMFSIWWKEVMGKAIPMYIKIVKNDEKYVKKTDSGNFINVWIRTSELKGKIGSVELEGSEQLPVTDDQKAETVMRLMELNNAEIIAALADPDNLPFMRKLVRLPEFKLPGENDRTKQYEEIELLLQQQPISEPNIEGMAEAEATGIDPMQVPPIESSSIPIDPMVDNSEVEGSICRSWAVSEAGRLAKVENPMGYKNVLLHMKQHQDIVMQAQMQMMQMQAAQNPDLPGNKGKVPPEKPKGSSEITPENADARTPIK